ncbi:ABC-2 type transport system ATP-binding protein [Clostridium collagenovorans DSM 3089]|uniref:ABC-2 type transport system ATP-binding protein n=1 Tax=Clostridium collagenovorans DSM 3089 TaxID=1121306 RepID=A0A1M5V3R9_9CLOT|nr:ATP-binding cassette domain-containing protein [Clostridium collagenovorans]SHH69846.1 ABC-2 type transport system ATP-binding protein [Clostridium collagenovorans DSM 3089]
MKNNIIQINNLSKIVGSKVILDKVNLNLEPGKIYGIVGRNGSGKTMLFKSICGFIKPSEGEIFVFNKAIHKGDLPEDTGVIIENPGFLLQYSGFKNLEMLASIKHCIGEQQIKDSINLLGLDAEDKTPVKKYSLGMKQRLGIAQAIMENPKLLILDEPMNGLDEEGVELVRDLLLKLKSQNVTILIASHNKEDIEILCDEIYKMNSGKLSLIL